MKRILIKRLDSGFQTALTDGGKLVELIKDPASGGSVVGNIYAGIVKKINTGFIFLDIGLEKQAFLDSRDAREKGLFADGKLTVKQGDTLIVQILKDAIGDKGPVATVSISTSGRYFVLSKSVSDDHITFSRKLDEAERKRLRDIAQGLVPPGFSAILRSAAKGRTQDEISREISTLMSRLDAQTRWTHAKPPAALFVEPPILKTVSEIATDDIDEILTDCPNLHGTLRVDFPAKTQLFEVDECIFAHYFMRTQIDKMRDKKVWLKSGAFIVIEQTEACVAIDVNTGKSSGKAADAAKLKANIEAAKEIAYQLRLRNLSGICIIDFLHMRAQADINALTEFLRDELAKDRITAIAVGMTALGLMEVTRKRGRANTH